MNALRPLLGWRACYASLVIVVSLFVGSGSRSFAVPAPDAPPADSAPDEGKTAPDEATEQAAKADYEADPKARAVMDEVVEFFGSADALSVDATLNIEQSMPEGAGGGTKKMEMVQTLSLDRPDKFSLVTRASAGMTPNAYIVDGVATIVLDRESIIRANHEGDLGAVFLEEDLGYSAEAGSNMFLDNNTAAAILREFIFSSEKSPWDDDLTALRYVGEEEIDGAMAHHLKLTTRQSPRPGAEKIDVDVDLWIAAGDQPLLLRVVPDTVKLLEAMSADNPAFAGMKLSIVGTYDNWNIGKAPPDSAFKPDFDADATVYASFDELLAAMQDQENAGDPQELVGTDAPAFEIAMRDGSTFKLADEKGKHVVILDFWATWCGPCMKALPVLIDTAKAYADKGVILVAVNQGEDKATIDPVLEEKKWNDLRVALDTEGAVGALFRVQGIPQTVIVGKDGKIRKVHVGFSPDLAKELAADLDAILAESE